MTGACPTCQKPMLRSYAVGCSCHKYGYPGHEDLLWCSTPCMELAHPDAVFDDEEYNEWLAKVEAGTLPPDCPDCDCAVPNG
jgi:hypothetical protein